MKLSNEPSKRTGVTNLLPSPWFLRVVVPYNQQTTTHCLMVFECSNLLFKQ